MEQDMIKYHLCIWDGSTSPAGVSTLFTLVRHCFAIWKGTRVKEEVALFVNHHICRQLSMGQC